jgi:hypothetical protein
MKYGFIYIWRDKKHNRYYIGSHWGREDDGYLCSSNWMRDSYKRRPQDFRRRVVVRIYTDRQELLSEEYKWLSLIDDSELGNRYYNLRKSLSGLGAQTIEQRERVAASKRGKKLGPRSDEVKEKIAAKQRGRIFSPEHKAKLSIARKARIIPKCSEQTKLKMSLAKAGKVLSEEHKQRLREAWTRRKLQNDSG